jgi:hypothetical protein
MAEVKQTWKKAEPFVFHFRLKFGDDLRKRFGREGGPFMLTRRLLTEATWQAAGHSFLPYVRGCSIADHNTEGVIANPSTEG